ncbi:MAG: ferrous iron transport protein A [Crocinitomix sp.]|nr:ferrous iron transport protein A [Crocinitomix sp.]
MELRLCDLKVKKMGVIKYIQENPVAAKLAEFGLLPGTKISILNKAPFEGPIFILVDNNRIALRKKEAAFIIIE